ncbi:MAG TPA: GAF domain-containing protein [Beijerinckiaceae bacterium]|jgi:two-component sensor histidine kinase
MPKRTSTPPDTRALQRLLDYQRALGNFSRVATETLPVERILQHAAASVSRVTHVRHVKVLRYRADEGDLLIEAGVGWRPNVVGHVALPIDEASPPGRALQTGAAVMISDLEGDSEFRASPLLREHGIVALLNVPIRLDGGIWGVLEVDSTEPRAFDEGDIGFLSAYANMLGLAMQRVEADRKAVESVAEAARKAAAQEVMLRELQHRMRNNFQIMSAFIALQRRRSETPDARARLTQVMERVQAIALAHDQLSVRQTGEVEFGDYLRALCANIDPGREAIRIRVDASAATLPLDRAVPAGLVVNELVTNALKYAFGDEGGTVTVTFALEPSLGEACVQVEDDGCGFGAGREGGLGLTLVNSFADQLGGRVERDEPERGTRIRVVFPLPV